MQISMSVRMVTAGAVHTRRVKIHRLAVTRVCATKDTQLKVHNVSVSCSVFIFCSFLVCRAAVAFEDTIFAFD